MAQETTEGPRLIHMLMAGPMYSLHVGKRTYFFEMHRFCGPVVVDHRGEPKDKQPLEGSRFWSAVTAWDRQGRRVRPGGVFPLCVFEEAEPDGW